MPTEKARAQRSLLQRARQKFFKWIRQLGSQNDNGGNGGEAQLDEECAKVFAMDTDSMGFDFHDRPFPGQPKYGEKDFTHHRKKNYPHMHVPLKISSKSMKRNRQQQQQPQQPPAPQCQSSAGGGGGGVTSPPSERSANGEARTAPAPPIPLPPPLDNPLSEELTSPPKSGAESDTGPLNSLTLQEESDGDGNSSGSEYVLSDPCTYLTKIEYQEEEDFSPTRKVSFLNNENIDQFDVDGLKNKKRRRHHHHHGYHFKFRKYSLPDDPTKKRLYNEKVLPTSNNNNRVRRVSTQPEDQELPPNDRDQLDSHRSDDARALRRHKATRPSNTSLMHIGKGAELHPSLKKLYDHSPHAIFVELAELTKSDNVKEEKEWKETARWIKYEEDVEEGVDRWGKPHVASLSFHSLLNLRRCLEEGLVILDMEEKELPAIAYRICEELFKDDLIKEEDKGKIMRTLLARHRHVNDHHDRGFRFSNKKHSYTSLQSLWLEDGLNYNAMMARCSITSAHVTGHLNVPVAKPPKRGASYPHNLYEAEKRKISFTIDSSIKNGDAASDTLLKHADNHTVVDIKEDPYSASQEDVRKAHHDSILKRIPIGAQGSTVLVGEVDFLEEPAIAFVRLAEGAIIPTLIEVNIPVRFIFVLIGPKLPNIDYHEVGRSISTLMANQQFHSIAYRAESRKELLSAINEFLDDSIVLPPGDWERQALLPIEEIKAKSEAIRIRKENAIKKAQEAQGIVVKAMAAAGGDDGKKPPYPDPLERTRRPWGGLINDLRRRYPHYKSDITDSFNAQCVAAAIFMYFAAVSGAIAFGGLTGNKTENLIGISETLLCTSIGGIIFAILAAQPLVIVGTTGRYTFSL
ncbi:unnamed protein product, partial [Callosobruchus maculatus]